MMHRAYCKIGTTLTFVLFFPTLYGGRTWPVHNTLQIFFGYFYFSAEQGIAENEGSKLKSAMGMNGDLWQRLGQLRTANALIRDTSSAHAFSAACDDKYGSGTSATG